MGLLDPPAYSRAAADAQFVGPAAGVPVTPPAGLAWDWTNYPFTASLVHLPDGRTVAKCSKTAADFFDAKSTARTAPVTTYYVNGTAAQTTAGITFGVGNDTNAGTTATAPLRSILTAITKGNATGQPYKIIIGGGDYNRSFSPIGAAPSVDCAILAAGRVVTGAWDDLTFTAAPVYNSVTLSNTYSATVANAVLVCAIDMRTPDGHYVELTPVATPNLVDATPGSYCVTSGVLYVQHPLRNAVGATTIRTFRSVSSVLSLQTFVNVYVGGVDAGSGMHFEGGINATINPNLTSGTVPTTDKVLAISGASARYCNGNTGRGISGNGWRGLIVVENFDASANASDGLNWHNGSADINTGVVTPFAAARSCRVLEINCSALNNGRTPSQSNQSTTAHEDMVVISLGGRYERGHGGTIRDINTAQRWAAGCLIADDYGDKVYGGAMSPTAIQHDDQSEAWYDRCLIRMHSGARGFVATATAKIHKRSCWPTPQPDYAQPGTVIDTY